MKSANTDLVQIKAVAETALADVQPQFMTPELCKWALVKASQGYSALEIRQTALEAQQIAINRQLAALNANVTTQNQLIMHVVKTQELQAQQLQQALTAIGQTQQDLAHRVQTLEETPKVENTYVTKNYENRVHVGDNCKGVVINLENSPDAIKMGPAWVVIILGVIVLLLTAGGKFPVITWQGCDLILVDAKRVCKEDVKLVPTKGEL